MDKQQIIQKFLSNVATLVPVFLENKEDFQISNGYGALCVIDESGQVWGQHFGEDKGRVRNNFQVAWKKASQVWITGYATGEFETLVWTGKLDEWKYPIMKPDYIGWEGGIPIEIGGFKFAAAFSGMRGTSDVEIIRKAAASI